MGSLHGEPVRTLERVVTAAGRVGLVVWRSPGASRVARERLHAEHACIPRDATRSLRTIEAERERPREGARRAVVSPRSVASAALRNRSAHADLLSATVAVRLRCAAQRAKRASVVAHAGGRAAVLLIPSQVGVSVRHPPAARRTSQRARRSETGPAHSRYSSRSRSRAPKRVLRAAPGTLERETDAPLEGRRERRPCAIFAQILE